VLINNQLLGTLTPVPIHYSAFLPECQCNEITYTSVMEAFTRAKQPAVAEKMMEEMKKDGICPSSVSYGVLISGYSRSGLLGDAERIFRYLMF
jgi:pentatricopeptide repeat protein